MLYLGLLIIQLSFGSLVKADSYINVEGNLAWQSRNDQGVPGDSGTRFSLAKLNSGPFPLYRIYAGHVWNKKHEIRALYAPLAFHAKGTFRSPVEFQGASFAEDTPTSAYYKFNSYRLTYAYHFETGNLWQLAVGFTAKVRDAEVRLEQGDLSRKKANVGFVPLLNLQASRALSEAWRLRFDLDGLAAPQGRAFDAGLFVERILNQGSLYVGYRTIEGGADNEKVYNFAWFHLATVGGSYRF